MGTSGRFSARHELFVLVALLGSCSDEPEPGGLFPKDVERAGYVLVRQCRAPGEHSALGGFTVWVDPDSVSAFSEIWQDPPGRPEMPPGSVAVKVTHASPDCDDPPAGWLAMVKEPGFAPSAGDWRWQELDAGGAVIADGAVAACVDCHDGGPSTTCVGYGDQNGRDYLCTEP